MSKKTYNRPDLIEYGTLEELTQSLSSGGLGLALQISQQSDRNVKREFAPVDTANILNRVAQLTITTWSYKAKDQSVRHIGPMAQDFAAMFGVGQDDKHINMVDANGIALAAIQALYEKINERDAQIAELRAEVNALKPHNKHQPDAINYQEN